MPSVLFVCTANRFRSPLAAALFKKNLDMEETNGEWYVSSAGTWAEPGLPVVPIPAHALQELQLDLSDHRSTLVTAELLSQYDLILVMEAGHREALQNEFPNMHKRIHLLSEVVEHRHYNIPDALGSEQEMAEVMAELNLLIQRGYQSIRTLAARLNETERRAAS